VDLLRTAITAALKRDPQQGSLPSRCRRAMRFGLLAATFAAGDSVAFAQYPAVNGYPGADQYPATNNYSGYNPASQPVYAGSYGYPPPGNAFPTGAAPVRTPPASSSVQQSDEQLLAIARVFEQQGRNAQAQRIYAELARRSAAVQSQAQPVQSSPAGMPYVANQGPYAAMPGGGGYAPQAAMNSGAWPTSPSFQPAYQPAYSMTSQLAPQMMVPPPNSIMTVGAQPMAPQQINSSGQAYSPYYGTQAAPLNSSTTAMPGTPATVPAESAPATTSTTPSPAWPPSNRAVAQATRSSGTAASAQTMGWRSAVTPLPEALCPTTPAPAIARQQPVLTTMAQTSAPAAAEPITAPVAKGVSNPLASSPPPEGLDRGNLQQPVAATLPADSPPELAQLRPQPPAPPIELPARSNALLVPRELTPTGLEPLPLEGPSHSAPLRALSLQPQSEEPLPAPLRPERERRIESFESLNKEAEQLTKETDAIRIIPGQRAPGRQEMPLPNSSAADRPTDAPSADVARCRWKQRPLSGADTDQSRLPDGGIVPWSNSRIANDSPESEFDRPQTRRTRGKAVDPTDYRGVTAEPTSPPTKPSNSSQQSEQGSAFDLAALMRSSDFREIHTPAVLDGLELLAERDPHHRALGAMRIGMTGRDARTALPVLRQVLAAESDELVRLRIAETLLKVQPNDRGAIDCLASLLSDRNDWQLRQSAACALSAAADGHNPIAVLRLIEALDDSNPRVRTMAALTLAQFHSAAADAIPRLELAVANDVPRVQQAAGVALASIKGIAAPAPSPTTAAPQTAVPQLLPSDSRPFAKRALRKQTDTPPEEAAPGPIVLSEGEGRAKVEDFSPVETAPALLTGVGKPKETNSTSNPPGPPPGIWTDAPSSPADPPGAPKALPAVPARPVRPLRLEPSVHHHVPGKPSQPTPSATFQLETEAGTGKSSVKP